MEENQDRWNTILSSILDQTSDVVIVTDADFQTELGPKIVYVNKAIERQTGYSADDLIGRSPRVMHGPLTDEKARQRILSAMRNHETIEQELVKYTKAGQPYWTELKISPVADEAGVVRNFISIERDISHRRQDELLARRQADLLVAGERIGRIGSWAADVNLENMYWSLGMYEILECDPNAPPPSTEQRRAMYDEPYRTLIQEKIRRCIELKEPYHLEVRGTTAKGNPIWASLMSEPRLDHEGNVVGIIGAIQDITENKTIEIEKEQQAAKLEETLKSLSSAQTIAKIGTFDYSVKEDRQYWSDELLIMTGFERQDFPAPAEQFVSRIDSADRPRFVSLFSRAIEHGEPYQITVRVHKPDGNEMHMQIVADVKDIEDDRRIVGIARDVTLETVSVHKLAEQEERFRIIAGTVSDVLWDYNFETGEFWASPDWPTRLGIQLNPERSSPVFWGYHVDPEDEARRRASFIEVIKSDATTWEIEYKLLGLDGETADVALKASILRRPDGRAYRMLGNARNVTLERRQQEGSTRARALEAVGQLTGGVAHDFNNLLMIIQGNAELLEMSELSEDDAEAVQLINQAAESAAALTARLLTFSGQTNLHNACVNLNVLLDDAFLLLRSGLPESIALNRTIATDIWDPDVDANSLEQVIVNLAMNARDAMPNGGEISIICQNRVFGDELDPEVCELEPGQYVEISVRDTGTGIPAKILPKVFEPFFTTKDVGKGTGLGLSTAYGFAKQSGGAITIFSEESQGTLVSLFLPACDGCTPALTEEPLARESEADARPGRILVVEDQPEVRAHVVKILTRLGFEVTSAVDAPAALSLLEGEQEFDLMFTDVIMPGGMNGQELAAVAREIAPQMKVLFTSGYPADAFEHLGMQEQDSINLLRKPYRTAELREAITRMLDT